MTKREFESRIEKEVTFEQYTSIEYIYMNYPVNLSKDDIATIFKIGGMTMIDSMMPKAKAKAEREGQISELRRKIAELEDEIENLVDENDK